MTVAAAHARRPWNCVRSQSLKAERGRSNNDSPKDTLIIEGASMTNILHAISIGSADPCNTIRDAFLQRGRCRLSVATNYRELFAIPRQESFEIAILHHVLSPLEFRRSSEYIRRTWPCAKILVVCAKAEVLDDSLYDDWVASSPSQEMLLTTIERLTMGSGRRKQERQGYQRMCS